MSNAVPLHKELSKVSTKGTKAQQIQALTEVGHLLDQLMHDQNDLLEKAGNKSHTNIDKTRLVVYDFAMPVLIEAFLHVVELSQIKQAGGRKPNGHFNLAYELLIEHYKATNKTLQAKQLVKVVNLNSSGKAEIFDANGNEPFSERKARECIKIFKICLPHEDFFVAN